MSEPTDETSAALDLLELIDPSVSLADSAVSQEMGIDGLVSNLCPSGDRTSRVAIASLLGRLGIRAETLSTDIVARTFERIKWVGEIRNQVRVRTPPAASSLVVTASGSTMMQELRREIGLVPLVQLVEDVVRSASTSCWLGSPYWNFDALERLHPALRGVAQRGGEVSFICQGLLVSPSDYDPLPLLQRAARDIEIEGGKAEIWGFTARMTSGEPVLLHAKFALADGRLGYLGSANMTRQGFDSHFEIGVRLGAAEVSDLLGLLRRLIDCELLARF